MRQSRHVLHVRFGGGIAKDRTAVRHDRGKHRVLGSGYARLVQEDFGACQSLAFDLVALADCQLRAQLLEREEMGIHPAPADDVSTRRWQGDRSEPGEQRSGQQDGSPDPRAEDRIERFRAYRARVDSQRVGSVPVDFGAEIHEQRDHGFHVADSGHVVQRHRAVGEECRGECGKRRVLVAGGQDGSAQGSPAADLEAWRHGQRSRRPVASSSATVILGRCCCFRTP